MLWRPVSAPWHSPRQRTRPACASNSWRGKRYIAPASPAGNDARANGRAHRNTTARREPAKPETRSPRPERNPNPEARIARLVGLSATGRGKRCFGVRSSAFLRASAFGLRISGPSFAGRDKALVVEGSGNGYLRTVCDYVHLNPVRAGRLKADVPRDSFRTTMPLAWIAEPLGMGSRGHLAWLQQQRRKGGRIAPTGQTLLGT